jgi:acylphosphatase
MSETRAHVFITGRVQGVCFRAYTQEEAVRRELSGWVRNVEDGRVEAVFEGPEEKVKEMVQWCHRGPSHARVTDVQVKWESPRGESGGFRITY